MYALRGGAGIDSVFQLGVAHAHIVAALPPPKLIVGISTGAVHAAAIAEILHAPAEFEQTGEGKREAMLHRFREILYAYQDFATDLYGAILPDAFEADAGRPLEPNPQAIHFEAERAARKEALKARSGLIALVNDIFSQSMTVRTMTRLLRAYAGWKATAELPRWRKWKERAREGFYMVKAIATAPLQCAKLANDFGRALIGGTARLARETLDRCEVDTALPRWMHEVLLRLVEGRHPKGYTAGQIVFSARRPRVGRNAAGLALIAAGIIALVVYSLFRFWFLVAVPPFWFLVALLIFTALVLLFLDDVAKVKSHLRDVGKPERILAYYDLLRDLGSDYLIEDLFIRIFDPAYHGRLDIQSVVDRAVRHVDDTEREADAVSEPRTFAAYTAPNVEPPIHVVPFVADLETGQLQRVEPEVPIVDGLKGAVSRVPFLHPVRLVNGKYAIDAASISSDAAISAIDVLRKELHPDVRSVRLFDVCPITPIEPPGPSPLYEGTVKVALAAMELSRFRDFSDEREIIASYNDLIPPEPLRPERAADVREPRALRCFGMEDNKPIHFVRTELTQIVPGQALHTTGRILREGSKEERQSIIAQAVAEGCRATLAARQGKEGFGCRAILGTWQQTPGATEVCRHCVLGDRSRPPMRIQLQTTSQAAAVQSPPPGETRTAPTINLLFSGGVFRGVFQIGVLNALSQLEVQPDVIAGSSVGSIVAAMIARVFTLATRELRNPEIARLAATFLTLDRLIITDRFSDFVRRFTLRAATAQFSLRDADLFFRNYDRVSARFDSVARRVIGGIEHLFYVSPYELSDLVREIRQQQYSRAYDLACRYAQEMCDRGTVGFEVLGAEPLALLIKQHVLDEDQRNRHAHGVPLSTLGTNFAFLLTATNLRKRELEIVRTPRHGSSDVRRAALLEALLASSAFPGVFRPRWAREVFFDDNSLDQYIDGGVLDNLPLSAVVDYLFKAAEPSRLEIQARPLFRRPHLVLTASLEPETTNLAQGAVNRVGRSWLAAGERAKRLRYNQKIDRFRAAQRDLRYIFNRYADGHRRVRGGRVPDEPFGSNTLDIEVVIVKPKWLCPTFAFHPMLGFRRQNQAASIAHGCAATFQTIARIIDPITEDDRESNSRWPIEAWRMHTDELLTDRARTLDPVADEERSRRGLCHFRRNSRCPFSRVDLDDRNVLTPAVREEIDMIYRLCGKKSTHEKAPA